MLDKNKPNPWKIIGEKNVYDNKWINVTEYDVINPSGGEGIYGKVHFKNIAVGVIALDEAQNIYLVGQYRFVLNQYSWEIPEGGCPQDEDYLEGCKRELLEETGLTAGNWRELLRMHLSNSVSDELAILYLATDLKQEQSSPDETEDITVARLPFTKAVQMVNDGLIMDAMSIAAIQKLQLMILLGEL